MTAVETQKSTQHPVHYKTVRVNNQDIFYREAGPQDAPVILLLHGFPTSSNMFRNLIPRLPGSFRLIAPDYPGYGQSSMPDHKSFQYTFENLANIIDGFVESIGLSKYSMYVMDYGAPIGYRLALAASRTRAGTDRAKWQCLRGRAARVLEPHQKVLGRADAREPSSAELPERCEIDQVAVRNRRGRYFAPRPHHLAGGSGWPGSAGKSRHPDGSDAFVRDQCAPLPRSFKPSSASTSRRP